MKIVDCVQGSDQWLADRLGIPTASCFDRIVTPAKGELSKQASTYRHELIAEWVVGPLEYDATPWMDRGSTLEAEAVAYYAAMNDVDPEVVGFVLRDDGLVGCSPDRLVGDDGLLEIKCPSARVHVGYVLDGFGDKYRCQRQGCLWLCEREWIDIVSYCPGMQTHVERETRDEEFIKKLADAVDQFLLDLANARAEWVLKYGEPSPWVPQSARDDIKDNGGGFL